MHTKYFVCSIFVGKGRWWYFLTTKISRSTVCQLSYRDSFGISQHHNNYRPSAPLPAYVCMWLVSTLYITMYENIFQRTKIIYSQCHSRAGMKDALCYKFWMLMIGQNCGSMWWWSWRCIVSSGSTRCLESCAWEACNSPEAAKFKSYLNVTIAYIAAVWPS